MHGDRARSIQSDKLQFSYMYSQFDTTTAELARCHAKKHGAWLIGQTFRPAIGGKPRWIRRVMWVMPVLVMFWIESGIESNEA